MCTLIVFRDVWMNYPIMVAANRDELLDRLSEPPSVKDEGQLVLAPKDLQRGGTWNGVNESGVFAAITNRIDVVSVPERTSRGEVVRRALRASSASQAFKSVMALKGGDLNGFNLVIADRREMFLVRGDGKKLEGTAENRGVLVVTNQGLGRSESDSSSKRVQNVFTRIHALPLWFSVEALASLLDIHEEDAVQGTCIHQPELNYGTKSSSIILLDDAHREWQYWHRERSGDGKHVCAERFGPMLTLPIIK
jgi:uncharacterized protein with NRDE domain